jgi:hypothetical protein
MSVLLLGAAVLITAAVVAAVYGARRPAPKTQVLDAWTDQELRARYLSGQISIGVYLDRRFGTDFSSAGDRRRAG